MKNKLKEAIDKSGLNVIQFADKMNVTKDTVYKWINGTRDGWQSRAKEVCEICNISADWLFDVKGNTALNEGIVQFRPQKDSSLNTMLIEAFNQVNDDMPNPKPYDEVVQDALKVIADISNSPTKVTKEIIQLKAHEYKKRLESEQ